MHEAIIMESAPLAVADQDLVPITANQRIEALDVVRGFALLGIFTYGQMPQLRRR